jgi:ABC-type lipoprotein release transport system permease subunit
VGGRLPDWRDIVREAKATPGVTSAVPMIEQPLMRGDAQHDRDQTDRGNEEDERLSLTRQQIAPRDHPGLNGHAVVQGVGGRLPDWRDIVREAKATPGVTSAMNASPLPGSR